MIPWATKGDEDQTPNGPDAEKNAENTRSPLASSSPLVARKNLAGQGRLGKLKHAPPKTNPSSAGP